MKWLTMLVIAGMLKSKAAMCVIFLWYDFTIFLFRDGLKVLDVQIELPMI